MHHTHDHAAPTDGSRQWNSADGVHLDLRGLTEPAMYLLRALDSGTIEGAVVGHFDQEPIALYPDQEERGWSHEAVDQHCGTDCEGGFMLRMVRWIR